MVSILQHYENRVELKIMEIGEIHPIFLYLMALIGIPILLLGAVALITVAVILPLALLFGWV